MPAQKYTDHIKVTVITVVSVCIALISIGLAWAHGYKGTVGPGLFIGPVELSGRTPEQAREAISDVIDDFLTQGIVIKLDDQTRKLPLSRLSGTDSIEFATFDVDELVEQAMTRSHGTNVGVDLVRMLQLAIKPQELSLNVHVSQERVIESIYDLFPEAEQKAVEPKFLFTLTPAGWQARMKIGQDGKEFVFDSFLSNLELQLSRLADVPLVLNLTDRQPTLSDVQAENQTETAIKLITRAPILLEGSTASGSSKTWTISQEDISGMIIPSVDAPTIDRANLDTFIDTIAPAIEQQARDAKLELNDSRVTTFVESRNGILIDRNALWGDLMQWMTSSTSDPIVLATIMQEPRVKTGDVNNLGITQILGTGTSSYRGSPNNRRANIQNGVRLLNGLLIAPDETFSLINALKPFEVDNGYLPELVIKGDKIEPELGGGLCQIGTTTFRAVMNAGLSIIERRNHSLVVSYYNDPANGNPGTDATLYEPAPDFKFKNDTAHHILLQAENMVENQELRFTFWGTSDGRNGSYTPPVVERWIPVPEPEMIETLELEPGQQQCQEAHIGADASFDYTVVRPSGEIETTTFESHYRPLPKICLVGVEKISDEEGDEAKKVKEIGELEYVDEKEKVIPTEN
jgi:vancomycin resistance protein YoaR